MAVTLTGQARTVWSSPSWIRLFDIGPGGRALLGTRSPIDSVDALFARHAGPVDVTLRAQSVEPVDLRRWSDDHDPIRRRHTT